MRTVIGWCSLVVLGTPPVNVPGLASAPPLPQSRAAYVASGSLASPHAIQAAAADEKHVYAVSSTQIVKYERATGKELSRSTGQAEHLNSGFLWEGKLYCAHS